eukprot:gene2286-2820_t
MSTNLKRDRDLNEDDLEKEKENKSVKLGNNDGDESQPLQPPPSSILKPLSKTKDEDDSFIKKKPPLQPQQPQSRQIKQLPQQQISFNITSKITPPPPPPHQQQQQHISNNKDDDDDDEKDDDNKSNNSKNVDNKIVGPPKPTSAMVGPPRPVLKNNDDESSSSSDSDDDDKSNNNKMVGPPKPNTTTTAMVGPPRPSSIGNGDEESSSSSDSDSDSDDDDSDDEEKEEIERWVNLAKSIPISDEVVMKCHNKTVSSLSLDPGGSRLLTGGFDCKVKFWDFNGMTSELKSFREVEPTEGAQIRSVLYNQAGDRFMVLPYTTQMKLYDRDGFSKGESVSGDRYIQDLYHTKGHVSILTGACWHPSEKDEIMSSSIDGTIRIWDCNQMQKNKSVIKCRNTKGARIGITSCDYDIRGELIGGGCSDGSISVWDRRSLLKSKFTLNNAHKPGTDVSSVKFNRDGYSMISRGLDHTLKVWDLRILGEPLAVFDDLPCDFLETNCIFASFDRVIVTGTSAPKDGFGTIVFFDLSSLTKMRQIKINQASAINCLWNSRINQVMVSCSDGNTRIFYDPDKSEKGIKLCVNKAPRRKDPSDFVPERPIYTPHALPLFREKNPKKEQEKLRNSKQSQKPQEPIAKTMAKGPNLTQHLIKNTGLVNDTSWKEDPREAFLAKAEEADKNPLFFKIYQKNQPVTIFQQEGEENDEENQQQQQQKK